MAIASCRIKDEFMTTNPNITICANNEAESKVSVDVHFDVRALIRKCKAQNLD